MNRFLIENLFSDNCTFQDCDLSKDKECVETTIELLDNVMQIIELQKNKFQEIISYINNNYGSLTSAPKELQEPIILLMKEINSVSNKVIDSRVLEIYLGILESVSHQK